MNISGNVTLPAFTLKAVNLYIDGSKIYSLKDSSFSYNYTIPTSLGTGSHILRVEAVNSEGMKGDAIVNFFVGSIPTPTYTPTNTPTNTPTPTNSPTPTP